MVLSILAGTAHIGLSNSLVGSTLSDWWRHFAVQAPEPPRPAAEARERQAPAPAGAEIRPRSVRPRGERSRPLR